MATEAMCLHRRANVHKHPEINEAVGFVHVDTFEKQKYICDRITLRLRVVAAFGMDLAKFEVEGASPP